MDEPRSDGTSLASSTASAEGEVANAGEGERGSGMGLWLCGELVRAMGGAISADFPATGGSRFTRCLIYPLHVLV